MALCARREEKLNEVAETCRKEGVQVFSQVVDVTDKGQREKFFNETLRTFNKIDVLFNNAGLALGIDHYKETKTENLRIMFETNVFASFECTKLVLPHMIERQSGHLVFMGSVAGHQSYEGGSVYCASKHAQRAMIESLRQEISEHPIRITSLDPGAVETEFSIVRLGSKDAASKVYAGFTPLTANDIAECVYFALSRPSHVNIAQMNIFPVHQADARKISKKE